MNNAVRIRDKMMVVVKEMARDGAKSNEQLQSHPKSTREKYKACASTIQLKLFVQKERKKEVKLSKEGWLYPLHYQHSLYLMVSMPIWFPNPSSH